MIITQYLDYAAETNPSKIAIVDEKRSLSYIDLQREASHIAASLIDLQLFKSPVAIYLEKSIELISCIFGIAYSGNYYSVIDTDMPDARVSKIFSVFNPTVILTDNKHLSSALQIANGASVITYEESQERAYSPNLIFSTENKIIDTDVLYVLFTSGSTGIPKGVATPQYAVINYINAFSKALNIDDTVVFGNQVPFYFVMSIVDIFGTIMNRGTLQIIPQKYFMFPPLVVKHIAQNNITMLYWVPSALSLIANLDAFRAAEMNTLKTVGFSGEVMPIKQLKMWQKALPNVRYFNCYGPTEVTDGCSYYIVDRDFPDNARLPIGIPFCNTELIVLDENMNRINHGMGELCIRSASMTYGYFNDAERSKDVFIQNPLQSAYPEIVYRTGDLVEYNEFGELEYVGRKDNQIKHMGRRIELGEIEANVSSVEGVMENGCLYDTNQQRIILFYSGGIAESELKEKLSKLIPIYMMPQIINRLSSMPHNLNGKINRTELKNFIDTL